MSFFITDKPFECESTSNNCHIHEQAYDSSAFCFLEMAAADARGDDTRHAFRYGATGDTAGDAASSATGDVPGHAMSITLPFPTMQFEGGRAG